jgi:hypothetical protein
MITITDVEVIALEAKSQPFSKVSIVELRLTVAAYCNPYEIQSASIAA